MLRISLPQGMDEPVTNSPEGLIRCQRLWPSCVLVKITALLHTLDHSLSCIVLLADIVNKGLICTSVQAD